MTHWAQIFTGLLFYAYVDTQTVKASLWQQPIVSIAFNYFVHLFIPLVHNIADKHFALLWYQHKIPDGVNMILLLSYENVPDPGS